jgi:hypothetical protein
VKLTIIEGDFEAGDYVINSKGIAKGFIIINEIPYSEIIEITVLDTIKNKYFIKVKTFQKQEFKVSVSERAYKVFYDKYLKYGNEPKNIKLPVERKDKLNIGVLIFIGLMTLLNLQNNNNLKNLTVTSANKLCADYIGKIFGRSPSIISTELIKKDSGFFIKASYRRSTDFTKWENICHISGNTIIWAGINNGNLGRWRYEDEATIYFNSELNDFKIRY